MVESLRSVHSKTILVLLYLQTSSYSFAIVHHCQVLNEELPEAKWRERNCPSCDTELCNIIRTPVALNNMIRIQMFLIIVGCNLPKSHLINDIVDLPDGGRHVEIDAFLQAKAGAL